MKNNAYIVYFLTRSLFLGFGISMLISFTGKDTYLPSLLGICLGLIITYFYQKIITKKENQTLKDLYKKNKPIGFIAKALMLISSIFLVIYTTVLYIVFVISFLLVNTPQLYVVIPFIIIGIYCAFKGLKIINRVAASLIVISIVLSIFGFIGLIKDCEITNFLPILTHTPLESLKTTLAFTGISAFPNILTLHLKPNIKNYTKFYLLASAFLVLTILIINGVFGEALSLIFRFPEYMVLKQLKIFKFIEKVENVISTVWVFDLFITLVMAIYSIKETLPEKHNKLVTTIIIAIIILFIDKTFAFNYVNELRLYFVLPYISLILAILIIPPFMYLVKKNH